MSAPRPDERRLGLLACPNAASRGWTGGSDAQDDDGKVEPVDVASVAPTTQDALVDAALLEEEREGTTRPESDVNDEPSETVAVGAIKTNAPVNATRTEPSSESADVKLDENVMTAIDADIAQDSQIQTLDNATAASPEADRPSKRMRTDEESAVEATITNEMTSKADVLIDDTSMEQNKTPANGVESSEATSTPSELEQEVTAPNISEAESIIEKAKQAVTNSNPLTVSLEYESSCSCQHCTSVQKDNQYYTPESSCTNEKGQILTITWRYGDEPQCISLGSISGKATLELLLPNIICTRDVSATDLQSSDGLELDIFGYRLSQSNSNSIRIHRPEWMNALPLSVICPAGDDIKTVRVRIKSIHDNNDNKQSTDSYYGAHPEESYVLNIPSAITHGNAMSLVNERKSGVTFISDPWRFTADKIVNAVQKRNASSTSAEVPTPAPPPSSNSNRILVCGAKGVGKSTYLRYMINRMLSASCTRVAVLDLDSGQPELSPPGLLTLNILSKPSVADPPMHMICTGRGSNRYNKDDATKENGIVEQVVASYFFGDITSKSDPDTYINIANKLMYKYQEFITSSEYSDVPLLVNTDGWVKGLGYEILSAIVGVCNSAHIVQILGNTKAKSFDMSSFNTGNTSVHVIQSYDEYVNPVMEDGSRRSSLDSQSVVTGTLSATASDHRSHRICAYFLGGCDKMSTLKSGMVGDDTPIQFHKEKGLVDPSNIIGLTLCSMLPYAVPFHAVKLYPPSGLLDSVTEVSQIWGVRADMASNDILDSLSGAIVGLCFEPDASDSPSIVNCNAGNGVPILPCAGLGIIRSIDLTRRILYVLTPVHTQLLLNVTSFVGGNIGLPLECVYRGIYSDSFPYMSFGQAVANAGLGAEVMKSRNHSGRKK